MTSLVAPEVMSSCGRDQALARRRLQQKGDLFNQGGMWKLRWHEDKIGPNGERMRGWQPFVVSKDESFVLDDRPAQSASELVAQPKRLRRARLVGEENVRVERAIAEEFV